MAIDEGFIKRFEQQADLLRNIEKQVHEAVLRADKRIKEMREGKSMEEVFGPVPPKK
jgi:hypothetical protein